MLIEFKTRLNAFEIGFADKQGKAAEIYWQTGKPFYAWIKDCDNNRMMEVIIPEYFVTDFCSVPKIPFAYLMFGDIGRRAGLLHDALYSPWTGIKVVDLYTREPIFVDRKLADTILLAALLACGIPKWKAIPMYAGVRTFGWKYYHSTPIHEQGVEYTQPY
jgi:hypothetical protein